MKVSVYLHTILGRQTPEGIQRRFEVDLPHGSTLQALMTHLQVDLSPDQMMLVVNGIMADENWVLSDGDQVNLMPAMSGGSLAL
jgi:molybdopterin converting factor small subunit